MDDRRSERAEAAAPDLRAAVRVARVEEAERTQAQAELRGAELARLEMLQDALAPVLAQVPAEIEMFDCGLVPGPRARLFIDMIAFVEMAHDKRTYRFIQSTRHGRTILAEGDKLEPILDAVTAYIARRLVDREKALASVEPVPADPRPHLPTAAVTPAAPPVRRRGWLGNVVELALSYLGIVALCVLIVVLARYGYDYWRTLRP